MTPLLTWLARLPLIAQLSAVTLGCAAILAMMQLRSGDALSLWMTPDQQGRWHYQNLRFSQAAQSFADPRWKGVAEYRSGQYPEAAASFARSGDAVGFFNRGNAQMKGREYAKAITSYQQAVHLDPDWQEAQENLALAQWTLEYIERSREQSDTGDDTELGADDYVFDNTQERGKTMVITDQSTIEAQSAEKWMRAVDTRTADFLRTRFLLEATQQDRSQ